MKTTGNNISYMFVALLLQTLKACVVPVFKCYFILLLCIIYVLVGSISGPHFLQKDLIQKVMYQVYVLQTRAECRRCLRQKCLITAENKILVFHVYMLGKFLLCQFAREHKNIKSILFLFGNCLLQFCCRSTHLTASVWYLIINECMGDAQAIGHGAQEVQDRQLEQKQSQSRNAVLLFVTEVQTAL